jgi:cysteine desulfurase / selenocysteine lyase
MYNVDVLRKQFKALDQQINGHNLVYLDSAATTLKPNVVVDRIQKFYAMESSNVHRGAHHLSDQATRSFEAARIQIQKLINAASDEEIIFTKGTTEGINLVATSFGENFLNAGDEIVITELEHHANLVPWQNLCLKKNLKLKYISVLPDGSIDEDSIEKIITEKTKLVAFSGCSNILGTFLPIEKMISKAKSVGAKILIDAAQLISQKKIDVKALDVDFLVFSSHKLFGPFGFGVLYGKKEILNQMPPYQYGGAMISTVDFEKTTYNTLPFKFEAGTPHVEGAVGTDAAIQFFNSLGIENAFSHEQQLLKLATEKLSEISEVQFFGTAQSKAAILSFNLKGAHHSDVGQILDQMGIAVRVGHHCTQPLLKKFNMTGTVRASFSIYNSITDIEKLILGVEKAKRMLL